MIYGKRGISNVVLIVLIIFFSIVAVIILYGIVIPMVKESSKDIEINSFANNIVFAENSIIFNKGLSRVEFSVNRIGKSNISHIQAVIISNNNSLGYNIIDIPDVSESKTYVLNTSGISEIQEIFVYPVFSNGKLGIGEKREVRTEGKVNENITVIDSSKIFSGCVSNWECNAFSNCILKYDLNNLLANEIELIAEQTRNCFDKNGCNSEVIERNMCDDKNKATLKKVTENSREFVEVYDINNNMISKLEFIPGEQNVLNIEMKI